MTDETLSLIEKSTGLSKDELRSMSLKDVEGIPNPDPYYIAKNPREITAHTSVYLFLKRFLSLDKVKRYISRI